MPNMANGCQRRAQARNRRERGQSLVEFALLLPIIVLLVMGLLMFGAVLGVQITLTESAAAGARQAVVEDYSSRDPWAYHDQPIYNAVVNALGWLGTANIQTITIYEAAEDGSMGSSKDVLDSDGNPISLSYPNAMRVPDSYIGVEVTYRQEVFVPLINLIIGEEIFLRGQRVEMIRQ